jgi:uncharacterized membrane protein
MVAVMKKIFSNTIPGRVLMHFVALTTLLAISGSGYGQEQEAVVQATGRFWLWNFLGRLHPLMVHFPVGLIVIAALLELFTLKNFWSRYRPALNVLIIVGAVSAVISMIFGWLLAAADDYGGELLTLHESMGIAAASTGIITVVLLFLIKKKNNPVYIKTYRAFLFISVSCIAIAGHYGASLTHGSDYLTSTLPWKQDTTSIAPSIDMASFAAIKNDTAALTPQLAAELSANARGILAHNCYKCHGAEKVKGDLRLDSRDMAFRGGESGNTIVPGKPEESELYKRIILPKNHEDVMPSKGRHLNEKEINLIALWIQKGAPWPADGKEKGFRVADLAPRKPVIPAGLEKAGNPIDMWVSEYFRKHNIKWADVIDDRTYLRRIYLDIVGLLPIYDDHKAFAADPRPDKRAIWVRKLLGRNKDYALHWLTFWNDALRNDYTGTGYIDGGRSNITDWLYKSLYANKPYNQFVAELINPNEESKGFIKGIQWRGAVNASQRTEMQAAQNVAQVFLGLNLKCASCHNSFVNNWKLEDAYAFANIFADTSLEINRCDKPTGKFTNARMLWQELGTIDNNAPTEIKQKQLAENLVRPENGRIYRTIVNRIWAQFLGRGIVEPLDNMDNEPWSQDLLDWMASDFVAKDFDIKELIFLIATSNAYQQPSMGIMDANKIAAPDFKFKGMVRKRMTAEQFADAVAQVVGPVFPDSVVQFRPPVATASPMKIIRASLVTNNQLLVALGRPNRETVSTGRESQANLLQALELTNGETFNAILLRGAEAWKKKYPQTEMIVRETYRQALGREPTAAELTAAKKVLGDSPATELVADFFWAILLLPEFQITY